jgi:omega-amidase
MQSLTISIVQSELAWHDADANRQHFASVIDSIDIASDLIVLPEMFTTGFTMDAASHAEAMDGETVAWMHKMAAARDASVCGSVIIEDGGNFYNRFICVSKEGELIHYDKRHLFRLADEQHHYSAGAENIVFELNGFRLCPMVCYDLRFPVWSRNRGNYDLLLYVANWPSRRQFAWDTLLRARAIENLSFVAGVNRVGADGNEIPYTGGSSIIDYLGADLANLEDSAGVATAVLDGAALSEFRNRFAFHKDADSFRIK